MRTSFALRAHPARWLFSDALLGMLGTHDTSGEAKYFNRRWNGAIWDVGASIGKFTTMLAKANPDHLVFAFEPNLNSLYYLGYRTARLPNVVIVPCAMTLSGTPLATTYSADFFKPPTGPLASSMTVSEAVAKFGKPSFAKFDIEGGEYDLFSHEPNELRGTHLLIEWHKYKTASPIPTFPNWSCDDRIDETESQVTLYYRPLC